MPWCSSPMDGYLAICAIRRRAATTSTAPMPRSQGLAAVIPRRPGLSTAASAPEKTFVVGRANSVAGKPYAMVLITTKPFPPCGALPSIKPPAPPVATTAVPNEEAPPSPPLLPSTKAPAPPAPTVIVTEVVPRRSKAFWKSHHPIHQTAPGMM